MSKKIRESVIAIKFPNVTFSPKGRVSKANYITPKLFEKQILWLMDWRYNPLSADEFKYFLFHELEVPMKSFIIILEGGYKNFKQYAYPILKRYKVPALIFLVVNHVGDYNRWSDGNEQMLSIDDITELNKTSMITFGLQSKSHRDLTTCSKEELNDEIVKGSLILKEITRYETEFFLYPYNLYNDDVIESLYEAGIPMAFVERKAQVTQLKSFQEIPYIKLAEKDGYWNFLRKIRVLENS